MSHSKDDFQLTSFKEKALEYNSTDEFQNCETYSQILDVMDKKDRDRQIQPREFYEGRRGARKRLFFLCQTFYPIAQAIVFIMIGFQLMIKLQDKHPMINNVFSDWNVMPDGDKYIQDENLMQHYRQQPFDDIKVFSVSEIEDSNLESWCKNYGDWFTFDQSIFDECTNKQDQVLDFDFDSCYNNPSGV